MAIEIGPIAKPHIWLEGTRLNDVGVSTAWQGRVDHAKAEPVTSMNVISGVTQFNDQDIITFADKVRIVIIQQLPDSLRPDYYTEANALPLSSLIKEGATGASTQDILQHDPIAVAGMAETWFTLNGKDPVRTKSYLNKYATFSYLLEPSVLDFTEKGFILGSSQTGSDLITLKAMTYLNGNKSRVAIVKFKIARLQGSQEVENGVPIESV